MLLQHVKQLLRNFLYFFFSKQIEKFLTYNLRKKQIHLFVSLFIFIWELKLFPYSLILRHLTE